MYLLQKNPADAECVPRAAARGTVLRAVKVLTACQILPEPLVGMKHLEGPKNPDGLHLGIYIFVYVYKVHMCMYMLGGDMRSWTNCFFLRHIFPSEKDKQKM